MPIEDEIVDATCEMRCAVRWPMCVQQTRWEGHGRMQTRDMHTCHVIPIGTMSTAVHYNDTAVHRNQHALHASAYRYAHGHCCVHIRRHNLTGSLQATDHTACARKGRMFAWPRSHPTPFARRTRPHPSHGTTVPYHRERLRPSTRRQFQPCLLDVVATPTTPRSDQSDNCKQRETSSTARPESTTRLTLCPSSHRRCASPSSPLPNCHSPSPTSFAR